MAGEMVLSQVEIDALVMGTVTSPPASPRKPARPVEPPKPAASAPPPSQPQTPAPAAQPKVAPPPQDAAPPPSPKPPEPAPPKAADGPAPPLRQEPLVTQRYASGEVDSLRKAVADLSRQVAKMTGTLQRMTRLEEEIAHIYASLKISPEFVKPIGTRLDEMEHILDDFQRYANLQAGFQCARCKSAGLVAIHVKCTSCGDESWVGWWPKQEGK